MKKLFFLFCLIIIGANVKAQSRDAIAPYRLLTTDSTYITPDNLKKDKPVMLIYFSPDCTHCQHFMYELKPKLPQLKNIQVIMATFTPQLEAIRVFQRDFDLKKYHNIIIGTEGYTYELQKYYQIATFPFVAIYNKGKLVKIFTEKPEIPALMKVVKSIH